MTITELFIKINATEYWVLAIGIFLINLYIANDVAWLFVLYLTMSLYHK
jgi:hypothetical protein